MVTLLLIAVNVIVSLMGFREADGPRRDDFVFIPSRVARGQNVKGMLLSHFSHADAGHLLVNMLGLYFFGPVLERGLGSVQLLLIYVIAAAAADAAIFTIRRNDRTFRVLGASGSIAGVLFAAIVLNPYMNVGLLFIPIPIPGPIFAVLYLLLSTYFMGQHGSRVCHEAHIGGAVAGALLGALLAPHGLTPLIQRITHLI